MNYVLQYRDDQRRTIEWSFDARQAGEPDPDGTVPVFVFWSCKIQHGETSGVGFDRDPSEAYMKALASLPK